MYVTIHTSEGLARHFNVLSGVKQGYVSPLLLFIIVIDYILRNITGQGISLNVEKIYVILRSLTTLPSLKIVRAPTTDR